LNKPELVEEVAKTAALKKKDALAAVEAVLGAIKKVLKKDGKVQIVGFGTFEVRKRKARTGRNPRDPEQKIKIPATKIPVFRAGKDFKEIVGGKKK
jgi:DNA-binding protein HU-beta